MPRHSKRRSARPWPPWEVSDDGGNPDGGHSFRRDPDPGVSEGEGAAASARGRSAAGAGGGSRRRGHDRAEIRQPVQRDHRSRLRLPAGGRQRGEPIRDPDRKRVVRGRMEERAEARRQYADALQEGKRAALLEQERDDVFTVQVGNVTPGEAITARLTYSERLPFFENGHTELRLPTGVRPR